MNATGWDPSPQGTYPPVKLGGLAASQYSTVGTHDGSQAELRPFPGRRGQPRAPGRAVAGEHGFRFFPAYYLHIWDLFQRIPVYQRTQTAGGTACWAPTSRTVYGQRPAGGHPGHHGGRRAVPRLSQRTPTQPRRVSRNPRPTRDIGLHPERRRDLREQAAALPGHQSFASRAGTAEPVGLRLLRRTRQQDRDQPVLLHATLRRAVARNAKDPGRVRLALGRCAHQHQHLSAAAAEDGPPRQQGRRGAQRSHHRVVVRPLVPPPRRTRRPLRPRCGDSPRPSRLRPDSAAPSAAPRADHVRRRYAAGAGLHGRRRRRARGRIHHRRRCARRAPAAPWPGWTGSPPPSPARRPAATRDDPAPTAAGSLLDG